MWNGLHARAVTGASVAERAPGCCDSGGAEAGGQHASGADRAEHAHRAHHEAGLELYQVALRRWRAVHDSSAA